MEDLEKKSFFTTRTMTVTAMLCVISVILSVTPLGYVPIGLLSITIMHIPVIIAAIVEGRTAGIVVGLTFGLTSMIRSIIAPTPVSFVFWNPLISVFPRMMIGICSYYAYRAVKKAANNQSLGFIISALAGSFTNTVLVLGGIYVFYAKRYVEAGNIPGSLLKFFAGIFVSNAIPEAVFAALVTLAVCKALGRYIKN